MRVTCNLQSTGLAIYHHRNKALMTNAHVWSMPPSTSVCFVFEFQAQPHGDACECLSPNDARDFPMSSHSPIVNWVLSKDRAFLY
jgi:hypothetical protein